MSKKRILCYGDSNTWGWVPSCMGTKRFSEYQRWPRVLQAKLGDDYEIIEEGLGGRTTMFDDPRPEFPERNGLRTLPIILETHLPLDYAILMLGTTDTKEILGISSEETGDGMRKLIQTVKNYRTLEATVKPQILLIVPPIVEEKAEFAAKLFKGGSNKAKDLIDIYKTISEEENILYLDPTNKVKVYRDEGVHIDAGNHQKLAELIYKKIKI